MKVNLLKANFVGGREDLAKVIELLKSTGSFQMTKYKKGLRREEAIDADKYERLTVLRRKLEHACDVARVSGKIEVKYDELKVFERYESDALNIVKAIEALEREMARVNDTIEKNKEAIDGLRAYYCLPVAFSALSGMKSVVTHCGIMPIKRLSQFERDFDLRKMSLSVYPTTNKNAVVVLSAHIEDAPVAEVIYTYDFIPCPFTYDKDAVAMTRILNDENAKLLAKREQLHDSLKVSNIEATALKAYYDFICNEIDTLDLVADTIQTDKYYVINGWVIASDVDRIQKLLRRHPDVAVSFEKPSPEDEMPVVLKNSKFVTPFKNITSMYGLPSGRDIDPNPWVALFYFIFFGMMIGDIGYGIVLCLAVTLYIYYKKPTTGTRQFLMLFGICSISSILWGLFYGSVFGFTIPTRVVDPLQGAIYVLLMALGLGLIQLAVGITINLWLMLKNGEYFHAILKGLPRVILFVGLILFLPKLALQMFNAGSFWIFDVINPVGMYITIVGAIGTAMTNPYSLISYFNDVISYVRLFALALVGTVIATIGNTMGMMLFEIPFIGLVLGFVLAVAFHTFNLGLGLLGAYIHGARLQFIEFFGKFYSGGGTEFQPIGGNLRYSYIKGGK